jgi:hypothetical protein
MATDPSSRIHEDESAQVPATGDRTVDVIPVLTVKTLAKKLEEIEADKKWGYEHAILCIELLSYDSLNALVAQGGPDNDPNLMPSRFCLLKGATDKGLKAKGNLDPFGPKTGTVKYEMHGDAPHTMSVQSLADLLAFGGYFKEASYPNGAKDPEAKPDPDAAPAEARKFEEMDDELIDAMNLFLANSSSPLPEWEIPKTCKVEQDDSLSSIARAFGIRNWRLIWEMNQEALGNQWDHPPVGTELRLPDTKQDPLGEADAFSEWLDGYSSPLQFADKGYQYPGIYLSLTILDEDHNVASFDKPIPFSVHVRGPVPHLIHHAKISKGDEIDFVVPDAPRIGWGLKGNPIASLGEAWFYYTEDSADEEGSDTGPDKNNFDGASKLLKIHVADNKASQK